MMRRTTVILLVVSLATASLPAHAHAPAAGAATPGAPTLSPEATAILDGTPAGPLIRLFAAFGRRNGVYREAGRTQSEIRRHYDRLVETAKRQQDARDQTRDTDERARAQYRAYLGARVHLENERARALDITEDEKRAARTEFKKTAEREIANIVLNTPGALGAIGELRQRIDEVRQRIADIREAVNTGNPLGGLIDEVNEKLDRLARVRSIAETVHGPTGRRLASLESDLRKHVDRLSSIQDEANVALDEVDALGQDALSSLDRLSREEPELSDLVYDALAAELERLVVPDGDESNEDVITLTLFERLAEERPDLFADLEDLPTMRARVRATLIRETLFRIATRCGRIVGALRRSAGAGGDAAELDDPEPCALFRPERLVEFLNELRDGEDDGDTDRDTDADTNDDTETPDAPAELPAEAVALLDSIPDGTFTGAMDESVWTNSDYTVQSSSATLTKQEYSMELEIDFTVATDLGAGCTSLLTETFSGVLDPSTTTVRDGDVWINLVGSYVRHQRSASGCEVAFDYGQEPREHSVLVAASNVTANSLLLELSSTPFTFAYD